MAIKKIGTVIHFYDKILVAIIKLAAPLKTGANLKFKHGDNEFTQTADSMEFEHKKIDSAKKGEQHFAKVIQNKDKPEDMPELAPSKNDIITVLVEAGFVKSNSDARRDIAGGGVRINDEKVSDANAPVKSGDIVQKGKRFFVKISAKG